VPAPSQAQAETRPSRHLRPPVDEESQEDVRALGGRLPPLIGKNSGRWPVTVLRNMFPVVPSRYRMCATAVFREVNAMTWLVRLSALCLAGLAACSSDSNSSEPEARAPALDPCAILTAARPAVVLGEPLGEASMIAPTMCSVNRSDAFLRSASLNLTGGRLPDYSAAAFFEAQREGLELLGIGLDDLHEITDIGDFAVWAEYRGGMQMWVFWNNRTAMIVLNGVDPAQGLPWSESLARTLSRD